MMCKNAVFVIWKVMLCLIVMLLCAGSVVNVFAEERGTLPAKSVAKSVSALIDPNASITITGNLDSVGAQALAQSLVGNGVTISNVTVTCEPTAAGTFTISGNAGIGLSSGIILGSGAVANVVGPNLEGGKTSSFGIPGDTDLDAILATGTGSQYSSDACVLEFDFVPQSSVVSFNYVFGSDEYNYYVNTSFNDVFGFFINGQNCALINGYPVSINNINNGNPYGTVGLNSEFYINNDPYDPVDGSGYLYNTELDGFTKVLTCSAPVTPGVTNHIKLAIADAGDSALDSDVFIGAQSFTSTDYAVAFLPSALTQEGNSNTKVTYLFEVKNLGSQSDSYNLTLNASGSVWPTTFSVNGTKSMKVGPLLPLQSTFVYVDVAIPKAAVANDVDFATLTATSVGAGTTSPVTGTASIATTALGLNNCIFIRDLPTYYIPGIPMPVSIQAVPTCLKDGDTFWALEDIVPDGWLVDNISNGGVFSGGKVTFNNLPPVETTLSYTIKPAPSQAGTVIFSGTGSVSGIDIPVTGDSQSDYNAGYHPADKPAVGTDTADFKISIGEYTQYGAFWKSGKEWPLGWNPITAAFVSKAGEIWQSNSTYHYDANAGKCPDCWVVDTVAKSVAASVSTLTRSVASSYQSGVSMNVGLQVTPPTGTKSYVVEETPPAGWAVSDISDNGNFDAINKKIKWGIFNDAATVPTRTLAYVVTPAANESGVKSFSGVASFDGVDVTSVSTVSDLSTSITITTKPLAKPLKYKGVKGKLSFKGPLTATLEEIKELISWDQDLIVIDLSLVKYAKGKGALTYVLGPNPTTDTLTGTITVGNATYEISQAPTPCVIKSVITSVLTGAGGEVVKAPLPKDGGEIKLTVDVYPETCTWKISSAKLTPCAKGTDPLVCLESWFENPGNFPEIGEILTGDMTFVGTVGPTEKARAVSGKLMIDDGGRSKSVKPFSMKQVAK